MAALLKLADIAIGLLGIGSMYLKFRSPGGLSQKDLLQKIEELERESERHRLESGSWQVRYQYLKQKYEPEALQMDKYGAY